ncbi:hypothetical protein [Rhodococcus chondri]|uniref:Uncharacterized protein n=1 Tax=Rhodococcus chondri TaxID=3065941 RepID=A0ABU7JLK0_9NOCA|nr:hypothetical protein [Rhodococcus sp. CC-R104]MEE2030919.1 hypothetical protein [Rhodococcus sp. CC-R104]
MVVTVERLREHIKRTLAGFDPTRAVHERADYLRRAVEDNRLGERLHLLVISEQSLYLWPRLRIERVRSTEPDHLQMVLDDARTLLADNAEQDGMLLHHASEHLADYARMGRLDGFRWGATHNLSHDIVQLREDLDRFAEARGRQIAEWTDAERPSVADAIAEVGSLAISAGSTAAGAVGRGSAPDWVSWAAASASCSATPKHSPRRFRCRWRRPRPRLRRCPTNPHRLP